MDETGPVGIEVRDAVAILTLARPAQRNAMSSAMVRRLLDLLPSLDEDPQVRVAVLAGAGAGFCAGSDLGGLARMTPRERSVFEAESGALARLLPRLALPVIAAVEGFAIGGGLTLAAGCDIVVTAPAARWSLPEVPIGLFPAWGLEAVTLRIGRVAARRLAWGIETLDGVEALRLGLADQLAEAPLIAALEIAARLAALPAAQSASVKRYFATTHDGEDGDALANALFMDATTTDAAQASLKRFAAK